MLPKTLILMLSIVMSLPLFAASPAEKVIDASIQAAGGRQAFESLGVLKMEISQSETEADGSRHTGTVTAYVDTTLSNSRLEMPNNIVVTRNGNTGWATIDGTLDDRKQTPRMAPGTCRQKLFPLLLPFSLKIEGTGFSKPSQTTYQGQKMSKIGMTVAGLFFQSPLISTHWDLLFPTDTTQSPIARYLPLDQFIKVHPEGMQVEIKEKSKVGGVLLPTKVIFRGVDASGKTTSHTREIKIKYSIVQDPDRGLFISPETLEKLDEGGPVR